MSTAVIVWTLGPGPVPYVLTVLIDYFTYIGLNLTILCCPVFSLIACVLTDLTILQYGMFLTVGLYNGSIDFTAKECLVFTALVEADIFGSKFKSNVERFAVVKR